tara:strand:+ start:45 stop:1307 length:1263 start_codon:yes stop_codon:yes gene_type:complete
MKSNKFKFSLYILVTLLIISCSDDDDTTTTTVTDSYTLSGNITADKTLTAGNVWTLKGRVSVTDGATLTIEAGTVIKATAGTGADASTLIIARGGKINAQGTASSPIVMTSVSDNIQADGTYPSSGAALGVGTRGLWGGLLILGKAPCSFKNDVTELQIEGIPVSDTNGLYGGSNAADNSGTISYLSIRHGGAEIGEGNEINGLTLGGVGSGTTINNVEVIANVDDGIEFFGGTVNASNLLVWGQGDDGIDIDQAYSGTITNAMVVLTDASDHAFEIDGPEGSSTGSFTINGATIIGTNDDCDPTGVDGEMADYRKGATGATNNIYALNFTKGKDVELDASADAASYTAGTLTFLNWDIQYPLADDDTVCAGEAVDKIFDDKVDESTFEADASGWAEIVTAKKSDAGADESAFDWTFYKQ